MTNDTITDMTGIFSVIVDWSSIGLQALYNFKTLMVVTAALDR